MRGTADRVLVFQTSSDGNEFEVMISFDDGFSPDPVPAIVCTSVVTTFLGMSPADYSAILGALDQKSVKKTKNEVVCRFRSFQGVFWVEKQLSELIVTKGKGSSSKLIADMVLVDYAEDDAVQLCKSMMK